MPQAALQLPAALLKTNYGWIAIKLAQEVIFRLCDEGSIDYLVGHQLVSGDLFFGLLFIDANRALVGQV